MKPLMAIILVEPENPDNVGAIARAMKNMGLVELRLVRPVSGWKEKGKKMAVSAGDILAQAKEYDEVADAVEDLHWVIGTSRRRGPKRGSFLKFPETLKRIRKQRSKQNIGFMFGRESKGLDNASLKLCDWVTTIPVHENYPSVNLAQAVMVVAFSLFDQNTGLLPERPRRGSYKEKNNPKDADREFIQKAETMEILDKIERALEVLDYSGQGDKVVRIRACFHRLFKRSGLLESEAQMFRGLTRRIREKIVEMQQNEIT